MESNKTSRLPEGVGKKIVDALKKQSDLIDDVEIEEQEVSPHNTLYSQKTERNNVTDSYEDFEDPYWEEVDKAANINDKKIYQNSLYGENEDIVIPIEETYQKEDLEPDDLEMDSISYSEEPPFETVTRSYANKNKYEFEEIEIEEPVEPPVRIAPKPAPKVESFAANKSKIAKQEMPINNMEFSANVEILNNLISQLPAGVTRQTGAQIIRQTMEAMGLSMNRILSEAQQSHEDLGHQVRDALTSIEEYKSNIKALEKDVQKYRKQADALQDIISLFILSEKD